MFSLIASQVIETAVSAWRPSKPALAQRLRNGTGTDGCGGHVLLPDSRRNCMCGGCPGQPAILLVQRSPGTWSGVMDDAHRPPADAVPRRRIPASGGGQSSPGRINRQARPVSGSTTGSSLEGDGMAPPVRLQDPDERRSEAPPAAAYLKRWRLLDPRTYPDESSLPDRRPRPGDRGVRPLTRHRLGPHSLGTRASCLPRAEGPACPPCLDVPGLRSLPPPTRCARPRCGRDARAPGSR